MTTEDAQNIRHHDVFLGLGSPQVCFPARRLAGQLGISSPDRQGFHSARSGLGYG
jgi:hypothetical protein